MLLSDQPFVDSCFSRLPSRWRFLIDRLDLSTAAPRPSGRLGFAETSEFKGLESPFVIPEASRGPDDPDPRPSLYVAMTRARVGLWLVRSDDGGSDAG